MSNPNDRAFDVYLARGSNLSQRYRDEATDKPSPALDSLILTASRRAKVSMADMPAVPWYKRWRVPLGFAAVLVLGVSVALRTMLQESKIDAPPPVAPAAKSEAPPMSAAPAADAVDNKVAAPPTGAVMGNIIVAPKDAGTASTVEPAKEKFAVPEKIVIEHEEPQAFPAAPPALLKDKVGAFKPIPKPSAAVVPGNDTLERQAGSGPSGHVLGEATSERRAEQEAAPKKSVAEPGKADRDDLAKREQPPAAATSSPAPAEADVAALRSAAPSDGPRLPDSHPPIVDGKIFRANSAESKRAAEEKKKEHAAPTSADDVVEAPEPWLRRIAELRRLDRNDEANVELERFRKRYPEYPAPVER